MTNTINRIPYFYIIQHEISKKKYAGCRFSKNCNPLEFMQSGGYFTSSVIVKNLIKKGDKFNIIVLLTEEQCGMSVLEFETIFLTNLNCATDKEWFNLHNNDKFPAFGSNEYKCIMEKKYGITNPMQSKEMIKRISDTSKVRTGYDWPMQNPETKEKSRNTVIEKTGFEFSFSDPVIRERAVETSRKKISYDYPFQDPNWKLQYKEKTGYNNPQQNPEIQEKTRNTNFKRTGYMYPFNDPKIKQKIKESLGLDNCMQNPKTVEKANATKLLKKSRKIVLDILEFIKTNNLEPKMLNLKGAWMHHSEEILTEKLNTFKSS